MMLFQSTCPRGARLSAFTNDSSIFDFNPRAHEGHDFLTVIRFPVRDYFNPRAHEGHDLKKLNYLNLFQFQSTCPRGARQGGAGGGCGGGISIHVPTRGTTDGVGAGGAGDRISIHVPTRGTTIYYYFTGNGKIFQSTCPRGARRRTRESRPTPLLFQSTCPRGARLIIKNKEIC